jgi:hypothetical protein
MKKTNMILLSVLFSMILIVGNISISFADDGLNYDPPLKQIKAGVEPQDVKCNKDKVLFFKVSDRSPVCIYENSIKKLVSNDNVFAGWSLKENLMDWDYVQNKMNGLEFNHITNVSISNFTKYHINSVGPLIAFTQEFKSDNNSDVIFYNIFSRESGELVIDNLTMENIDFKDPRKQDYYGMNDVRYNVRFECNDESQKILGGDLALDSFHNIDKLFLVSNIESNHVSFLDLKNTNTAAYEFSSFSPTEFQSDNDILIHDVSETQCIADDVLFSSAFPIYYFYTVSLEVL